MRNRTSEQPSFQGVGRPGLSLFRLASGLLLKGGRLENLKRFGLCLGHLVPKRTTWTKSTVEIVQNAPLSNTLLQKSGNRAIRKKTRPESVTSASGPNSTPAYQA